MELSEKGSIGDLVRYRIETTKSDLKSADILLKEEEYRSLILQGFRNGQVKWGDGQYIFDLDNTDTVFSALSNK